MGIKQTKTTKASEDSRVFPIVQITYLERVSEAVIANSYGMHANPPKDTPALLITLDRDEASKFIIPLNNDIRPKGLKEGEVINGNFKVGSTVKFDKDGNITVTCKGNLNANITGNANIECGGNATLKSPTKITLDAPLVEATGEIKASSSITDNAGSNSVTMASMRVTYNSHTHTENGGTTDAPNQPMS